MQNSELSLEVSNSSNINVMRLYDTSYYCTDQIVDNYLIEVLPVNKTTWVSFNVDKSFSLALNSANLGYRKADSTAELVGLPDGIYEIKQSYKPNIHTLNHFYHFRITELLNTLDSERDKLLTEKCVLTRKEFTENRDKLRDIEEYAKAAKWKVEECGDKVKGKELYQFSKKLLEQYTNECQC